MARPRLPIGQHGRINLRKTTTGWHADTHIRKDDGKLYRIEANRPSKEGARIALEEKCREEEHEAAGSVTSDSTVKKLCLIWLESHKNDIRPQTYSLYFEDVHEHVIPDIGSNTIRAVKPLLIKSYLERINEQVGSGAAQTIRTVLNQIFDLAVQENAIIVNPARQIGRMRFINHRPGSDAIPPEKIPEFVENVKKSRFSKINQNIVLFLLCTGMRPGEALALTWDKVNFENKTVTINATSVKVGRQKILQQNAKTSAGNRVITVSDSAMKILREEYELYGHDLQFVFPNTHGGFKATTSFDEEFHEARKAFGFPELRLTPHSMRKTAVTWMHFKGISDKNISDYVGHANPRVTENVYMKKNVRSGDAAKILDLLN